MTGFFRKKLAFFRQVSAYAVKTMRSIAGVIHVTDAVADNARAVVVEGETWMRNQLVQPKADGSYAFKGVSYSYDGGKFIVQNQTPSSSGGRGGSTIDNSPVLLSGHTYLFNAPAVPGGWWIVEAANTSNYLHTENNSGTIRFTVGSSLVPNGGAYSIAFGTDNALTAFSASGYVQLVDLTQLCKGSAAKIAAISSWADLMAQYPEYAGYVAYDTGTVVGTAITLAACGKNLMNPALFEAAGGELSDGAWYFASSSALRRVTPLRSCPDGVRVAISGYMMYEEGATLPGVNIVIDYADGTYEYVTAQGAFGQWGHVERVSQAARQVRRVYFTYGSSTTQTWIKDLQIEFCSSATAYEPYHDGGAANTETLYAVVAVRDLQDVVSGEVTRRVGSYTFTGEEAFTRYAPAAMVSESIYCWRWAGPTDRAYGNTKFSALLGGYTCLNNVSVVNLVNDSNRNMMIGLSGGDARVYIRNDSCTTKEEMAAALSGKTIYYELATPTTSTVTAQPLALQKGSSSVCQTDAGRTASFEMAYLGSIPGFFTVPGYYMVSGSSIPEVNDRYNLDSSNDGIGGSEVYRNPSGYYLAYGTNDRGGSAWYIASTLYADEELGSVVAAAAGSPDQVPTSGWSNGVTVSPS